ALGVDEVTIALNCSSFDQYVNKFQPDIVLFDRFMMEEQFGWRVEKCCPQALRVLDTEDLHSLRETRHQILKETLKQPGQAVESLFRQQPAQDRKSTRLNSSHVKISYAVFCLKKKHS